MSVDTVELLRSRRWRPSKKTSRRGWRRDRGSPVRWVKQEEPRKSVWSLGELSVDWTGCLRRMWLGIGSRPEGYGAQVGLGDAVLCLQAAHVWLLVSTAPLHVRTAELGCSSRAECGRIQKEIRVNWCVATPSISFILLTETSMVHVCIQ